jgi:hypothetical protein
MKVSKVLENKTLNQWIMLILVTRTLPNLLPIEITNLNLPSLKNVANNSSQTFIKKEKWKKKKNYSKALNLYQLG